MAAIAARPADRHPITLAPALNTVAERVDVSGDLMTGGHRELHTGPLVIDEQRIGVADAAGLHRYPHPAGSRFGQCLVNHG